MAVGGDFCRILLVWHFHQLLLVIFFHLQCRYASIINFVNIAVCLIGAAAFAKASAVILGIVIICLSVVVISFLAQPALEVNNALKSFNYFF